MPTRSGSGGTALVGGWTLEATIPHEATAYQESAAFAGSGNFSNNSALLLQASVVLGGAGSFGVEATTSREPIMATAAFAGIGSLAASAIHFSAGAYDETGAATLSVSADAFTELEFGLKLDYDNLQTGDVLSFRVYSGGSPLDSYLQTPSITVPAHAINVTSAWTGVGGFSVDTSTIRAALSGEALLSGTSQFAIDPQLVMVASVAFGGVGSLTVDLSLAGQIWQATVALAGIGSLTAIAKINIPASVSWAGTSEFTLSDNKLIQVSNALFAGIGNFTIAAKWLLGIAESLSGVGGFTLSTRQWLNSTANFSGIGSLSVDVIQLGKIDGSALFQGLGTFTVATRQRLAVNSLYAGIGSFTIQPGLKMRAGMTAAMAGTGLLNVQSGLRMRTNATLIGAGTLNGESNMLLSPRATFSGTGLQTINATRMINVLDQDFVGVGSLTVSLRQRLAALAEFDGLGGLDITPRLRMRVNATFGGAGSFYADLTPPIMAWQGQAQFSGLGDLSAIANLHLPSAMQLDGAGGFNADAIRFIPLSETFSGAGSFLVGDVQQLLAGFLNYGGVGSLSVYTTITSAREEWLVCASIGFKPELDAALGISPELPGSLALNPSLEGQPNMKVC